MLRAELLVTVCAVTRILYIYLATCADTAKLPMQLAAALQVLQADLLSQVRQIWMMQCCCQTQAYARIHVPGQPSLPA